MKQKDIQDAAHNIAENIIELLEKQGMSRTDILKWAEDAISPTKKNPATCQHTMTIGDNYGVTCQNCGAQVKGFGHWAEFNTCIHEYRSIYQDSTEKCCVYCEKMEARDEV